MEWGKPYGILFGLITLLSGFNKPEQVTGAMSLWASVVAWFAAMRERAGNAVENTLLDVGAWADFWEAECGFEAGEGVENLRRVRASQLSDRLLQFVVIGFVILIGILVYSEFDTALPSPSNSELSNASSNATGTFSDSMELAPLVILVGVAGLLLAVVRNF